MVIVKKAITIDEMQAEIETLRNALVRLAVFVGGNPCWCDCAGGKHSEVCRDILKLKLWPRVTINGPRELPRLSSMDKGEAMTVESAMAQVNETTVERLKPGQDVIWLQQRKWGGKQNQPAIFLKRVGVASARIAVSGVAKTVRLSSLQWHREQQEAKR